MIIDNSTREYMCPKCNDHRIHFAEEHFAYQCNNCYGKSDYVTHRQLNKNIYLEFFDRPIGKGKRKEYNLKTQYFRRNDLRRMPGSIYAKDLEYLKLIRGYDSWHSLFSHVVKKLKEVNFDY